MTSKIFSGDHWTDEELTDFLKKLEQMYAQGVRSAMYKDQRLDFASTREMQQRMSDLRGELEARGVLPKTGSRKKQIRVTTKTRGFSGKG